MKAGDASGHWLRDSGPDILVDGFWESLTQ